MKVFRLNEKAELPQFATEGSACFDLKARIDIGQKIRFFNPLNKETYSQVKMMNGKVCVQLYPQQRMMIPTGLIFNIPKNHVLKIYPRSSIAFKKGLTLANGTGIIDSDYVEELFILVENKTDAVIVIEDGERIAQAMLEKTLTYDLVEVKTRPSQKTDRDGGIGSTGEAA